MKLFPNAINYDFRNVSEDNILSLEHLVGFIKKYKIDTIIHLAAYVSIPEAEKNPGTYIENNVLGTATVIEAALKTGVKKIVYASSSASSEPTSSVYAFTKYAPELLLEHYKDQIEVVSLRFFNVYGKGSNPAYGRAIDAFIDGVKNRQQIDIYGDGNQTRDFINVKDVAKGIKLATERPIPSGEIIDLGTGISISVNELASIIITSLGIKTKRNRLQARKEVRHSVVDLTKAKKYLDFKPEITLREGIEELIMEAK